MNREDEGSCDVQMPEEGDMDTEVREEDAADVAARKRAAAKAREEAELRQRSQVRCSLFLGSQGHVCAPSEWAKLFT